MEELAGDPRRHRAQRPELLLLPRPRAGPRPRATKPTCRCRSAACPWASRSSTRSRAGPTPVRSLVFKDRIATHTGEGVRRFIDRRRRGAGRPDHGLGVRRAQRQRHQAQRRGPQPVAARAHRRRLVRRQCVGGRRRARVDRERWRRWRLHPHPRRLLRSARHEGHLRAHLPRAAHAYFRPGHRRARLPGPLGTRRCPPLRRVRRRRPARPVEPPEPRPLGARPRLRRSCKGKRVGIVPSHRRRDARAGRRGAAPGAAAED